MSLIFASISGHLSPFKDLKVTQQIILLGWKPLATFLASIFYVLQKRSPMVLLWHFLKFIRTGTQNKAFDKWEGFLTTELKWPYRVYPSNSTMSGSVAIISPWILVAVKDGDGDFYDPDVWLLSWGWIDFKRSKMVISRG